MKRLLGKLFVGKKRKELLNEFAELIMEIPKVNSAKDCYEGYAKIAEFVKKLSENKEDLYLKEACGKLIEYLTDTKEHINKGYHKPSWNGWKTLNVYPNINDYVNMGVRLKTF